MSFEGKVIVLYGNRRSSAASPCTKVLIVGGISFQIVLNSLEQGALGYLSCCVTPQRHHCVALILRDKDLVLLLEHESTSQLVLVV